MDIDVFISHHTSSSLPIVEAIASRLEGAGIRCWYAPRDTEGSYAGTIARAIASCKVFLLILNKSSSESPHVLNEIDLATKRLTKGEDFSIIPFHIANDGISDDAQYYLGRLHWIDATTPPMDKHIDALCARIAKHLGRQPAVQGNAQKPDVVIGYHPLTSLWFAETITRRLEKAGIRCWYANRNGEPLTADKLSQAAASCRVFLLILNKPALESPVVRSQIRTVSSRQLQGENVSAIAFHIADDIMAADVQPHLSWIQWIDAAPPPADMQIDALCKTVRQYLAGRG